MFEFLVGRLKRALGYRHEEKRRHPRYECGYRTRIESTDEHGYSGRVDGRITNISESGCLFVSDTHVADAFEAVTTAHIDLLGSMVGIRVVKPTYNGIHCEFTRWLDGQRLKGFLAEHGTRRR